MRYTIVPSHYTPDDVGRASFERSQFYAVSEKQRAELYLSRAIVCLDAAKRIWRWESRNASAESFKVRSSAISLKVKYVLREVLVSEITRVPIPATPPTPTLDRYDQIPLGATTHASVPS